MLIVVSAPGHLGSCLVFVYCHFFCELPMCLCVCVLYVCCMIYSSAVVVPSAGFWTTYTCHLCKKFKPAEWVWGQYLRWTSACFYNCGRCCVLTDLCCGLMHADKCAKIFLKSPSYRLHSWQTLLWYCEGHNAIPQYLSNTWFSKFLCID